MMNRMDIYNAVRKVPDNAKREIRGGRLNGKTDINPMWRIKVLTELFGPCGVGWYYKTVRQWTENYGEEVAAFVNIEMYIKVDDEWSQPIFGVGGSMFAEKERSGIHVSDECFKMATTDAISVACKQLGIGADVYWDKDNTKYTETDKPPEDKPDNKPPEDKPDKRLEPVLKELKRIGYSLNSVCRTYKIGNIQELSDLQIKDFLNKAKKLPDKETA